MEAPIRVAGKNVEIDISSIRRHTMRITARAIEGSGAQPVPHSGSLVKENRGVPHASVKTLGQPRTMQAGEMTVTISPQPLVLFDQVRWIT